MSRYVVSCEHASGKVPRELSHLFSSAPDRALLKTHRALDLGARNVAEYLARELRAPLFLGTMSRLVIDLNRSPRHPDLFSRWTQGLEIEQKAKILSYHADFRACVLDAVERASRPVIHLSIHSFTPVLHDEVRPTEIGILYDPGRQSELAWAKGLQQRLARGTDWVVHRNSPYRGISDGHTKSLRAKFSARNYIGIEIEINQNLLTSKRSQLRVARTLIEHL